jgi:hypothetical protein
LQIFFSPVPRGANGKWRFVPLWEHRAAVWFARS